MKKLQVVFLAVLFSCVCLAQNENQTSSAQVVVVPRLIRFSGQLANTSGTAGVTFSLYKTQTGNAALWTETQNVAVGTDGKYSVLIGATKNEGIPVELFTSGEAQWLGVRVEGKPEQSRVLLVSVPYAMKAAEADTLAGHAASEFVTSDKVTTLVKEQLQQNGAAVPQQSSAKQAPVSNGTTPTPQGPTQFTGNTPSNVVSVVQSGAGTGLTAIAPGTAVYGTSTNTSGNAYGLKGASASSSGFGVYGLNTATSGSAVGIYGQSSSIGGVALSGVETSTTGITKGVVATVNSPNGIGAVFQNTTSTGKILSGQSGSTHTEVFSVDGAGNVTGAGLLKGTGLSVTTNAAIGGSITGAGIVNTANAGSLIQPYEIGGVGVFGIGTPNFGSVFVGAGAGAAGTGTGNNTFVGSNAGKQATEGSNTFIGALAGATSALVSQNVVVGDAAGYQLGSIREDDSNNLFGHWAGYNLGTGGVTTQFNTIIGWNGGYNLVGGKNNIYIGSFGPSATGSTENNTIRIGGDMSSVGGPYPQTATYIVGINGADASAGSPVYITSTNQLGTGPAAAPATGSANYIQNGTSAQSASFNVSGSGTIGGGLNLPAGTLNFSTTGVITGTGPITLTTPNLEIGNLISLAGTLNAGISVNAPAFGGNGGTAHFSGAFYGDGSGISKVTTQQSVWLPMGNCLGSTPYALWGSVLGAYNNLFCRTSGYNTSVVADFPSLTYTGVMTHWKIPANWAGNVGLSVKWFTPGTPGSLTIGAGSYCAADGATDNLGGISYTGTAVSSSDNTIHTTNLAMSQSDTCNAGDEMLIWIIGPGTNSVESYVIGAEITYGITN